MSDHSQDALMMTNIMHIYSYITMQIEVCLCGMFAEGAGKWLHHRCCTACFADTQHLCQALRHATSYNMTKQQPDMSPTCSMVCSAAKLIYSEPAESVSRNDTTILRWCNVSITMWLTQSWQWTGWQRPAPRHRHCQKRREMRCQSFGM